MAWLKFEAHTVVPWIDRARRCIHFSEAMMLREQNKGAYRLKARFISWNVTHVFYTTERVLIFDEDNRQDKEQVKVNYYDLAIYSLSSSIKN